MLYAGPRIHKTVYFVRHGQSEGNVGNIFQAPDSPLTEEGRKQAERIAGRLARLPVEALIASTLPRAQSTAEIIGRVIEKTSEFSDLFVERIKPTSVAGRPCSDEAASLKHTEWSQSLFTSDLRVEDGENYNDIVARADAALALLSARAEQSIAVVTHGFFLRALIARAILREELSGPVLREYIAGTSMMNTGLSVLQYIDGSPSPRWRLWVYNDHAHLG